MAFRNPVHVTAAVAAILAVVVTTATPALAGPLEDDLAALGDSHGAIRRAAANRLADRGAVADVLNGLHALLEAGDKPARPRIEAARVLARIGGTASVAPLTRVAGDVNAGVARVAAVSALAGIDAPEATNAVVQAIGQPDTAVRLAAIRAAGRNGLVAALPALAGAMALPGDSNVVLHALDAAAAIIRDKAPAEGESAAAREAIRGVAGNEEAPLSLRRQATFAWGRLGDEAAVQPLIDIAVSTAWTDAAREEFGLVEDDADDDDADDGDGDTGDGDDADGSDGGDGEGGGDGDDTGGEGGDDTGGDTDEDGEGDGDEADADADGDEEPAVDPVARQEALGLAARRDRADTEEAVRVLAGFGVGIFPHMMINLIVDRDTPNARSAFADWCRTIGRPALPRLIATLKDDVADHTRRAAETAVVALLRDDPSALDMLGAVENLEVAAVPGLARALEDVQQMQAVEMLAPVVEDTALQGNELLGQIRDSVEARRAVMQLFARMTTWERPDRGGHGYSRELAFERIIGVSLARVDDPDTQVRKAALEAIDHLLDTAERYERDRSDPGHADRGAAIRELIRRSDAAGAIADRLPIEATGELDADRQALVGQLASLLVTLKQGDAATTVVDLLDTIDTPAARAQLYETLTELPQTVRPTARDRAIAAAREDLLATGSTANLRRNAVSVLGWAGTPDAVSALTDAISGEVLDEDVLKPVMDELRRLGAKATPAIGAMGSVLDRLRGMYLDVASTTGTGDEARRNELRRLLQATMSALSATNNVSALDALLPMTTFRHSGLDAQAVRMIGQLARDESATRRAVPVLIDALRSKAEPDAALLAVADALAASWPLLTAGPAERVRGHARNERWVTDVLNALNRVTYSRAPLRREVGQAIESLGLLTHESSSVVRTAINLARKVRYAPLVDDLTAAWHMHPDLREQIERTGPEVDPRRWRVPTKTIQASPNPAPRCLSAPACRMPGMLISLLATDAAGPASGAAPGRSAASLRTGFDLFDQWWLAALLALAALALAAWVLRRAAGTPRLPKALRVGTLLGTLAVVLAVLAAGLAGQPRWSPTDDPERFHELIAAPNYTKLDAWKLHHDPGESPVSPQLLDSEQVRLNRVAYWPALTDAWGRPMVTATDNTLWSCGADGVWMTDDDAPIRRPRRPGSSPGDD